MDKESKISQKDILIEFFKKNPNRDIAHPEVVDWVTKEFLTRTGRIFRDPDRGIRKLAQEGFLIKIGKGVYHYDPTAVNNRHLEDFTQKQKVAIFARDGYKCVVCGRGREDGVEIQADHIKPKELGGKAVLDNGQTLCGKHNYMKKKLKQTEMGKKLFIHLHRTAKSQKDIVLMKFTSEILDLFEKYGIDEHISREQ